MSAIRHPESHQPVTSLDEFNREARKLAGLPEWSMDDPGRPFTPEYETPVAPEVVTAEEPIVTIEPVLDEDTTPSADARDLYRQPTPQELKDIRRRTAQQHIQTMRQTIETARAKQTENNQSRQSA